MPASHFVITVPVEAIPSGKYVQHIAEKVDLLIFRIDEDVFAIENKCSHLNMPLNGGRLTGTSISCPVHGGVFDVRSGCPLKFPAGRPVKTFPVRMARDMIEVDIGSI